MDRVIAVMAVADVSDVAATPVVSNFLHYALNAI